MHTISFLNGPDHKRTAALLSRLPQNTLNKTQCIQVLADAGLILAAHEISNMNDEQFQKFIRETTGQKDNGTI